jgi:hypothetical protein
MRLRSAPAAIALAASAFLALAAPRPAMAGIPSTTRPPAPAP